MATVAVAVSGGVDSLCSLLMLREAGHDLIALHGLFLPDAKPPANLEATCQKAGIRLEQADLRPVFAKEVINYYNSALAAGQTPNPCAICNRQIKFGALLDAALRLGADYLATGHYARLDQEGAFLLPAFDAQKDQSYFLSLVPQKRLKRVIFPLGGQTKDTTRKFVSSLGFSPPIKRESQDICFLKTEATERDEAKNGHNEAGPILLRELEQKDAPLSGLKEIGRHQGVSHYTIGQRKGLGIAWKEPLFVQAKTETSIVLAPAELLNMSFCRLQQPNYFLEPELWPSELYGRFRYRQKLAPIRAEIREDSLDIHLDRPQFKTAPGQIAVVYDGFGRVLAGGVIAQTD